MYIEIQIKDMNAFKNKRISLTSLVSDYNY